MIAPTPDLAALSYAINGWRVIPLETIKNGACSCWRGGACRSAGKHPKFDTGEKHAAATVDREVIRAWWSRWPEANVGIVTGAASGLVILDIDPAKGGNESRSALFPERTPPTLSVVTGSGGQHLYFQHPGEPVACRVGFRPGLDLRADGGLVVAPPSRHKSGGVYSFLDTEAAITPMPPELIAALTQAKTTPQPPGKLRPFRGRLSPYAQAALEREFESVATRPAGSGRHVRLYAAAAALGEMIAGGTLPRALVEERLREACAVNGMVAERRECETEKTIAAGINQGMRSPRGVPAPPWESRPRVTEWEQRPEVTSWKS